MKIEIGESLALSYLKHVKKCVLYQTNWKASQQWESNNDEEVEAMYDKICEHHLLGGIFKENSLEQLLRQAEIDVLGIDQGDRVYCVDIAFHENGLNYGSSKEECLTRVAKKLLRSYLILMSYFPNRRYEIIFASPKVNPAVEAELQEAMELLVKDFAAEQVSFKYISNEDFKAEFLDKTLEASTKDSDTAELFVRAMKLFGLYAPTYEKSTTSRKSKKSESSFDVVKSEGALPLEFHPTDEDLFKRQLIKTKLAKRTWYYDDGRVIVDHWNAYKIQEDSNLRGVVHSNNRVRARHWTGLIKLKLEIVDPLAGK